jgi:hypothetical protein
MNIVLLPESLVIGYVIMEEMLNKSKKTIIIFWYFYLSNKYDVDHLITTSFLHLCK